MKNVKSFFYWVGVLIANLAAFNLFALIIAMLLKLPNVMASGFVAWSVIICCLVFAAEDETRETIKGLLKKHDKK